MSQALSAAFLRPHRQVEPPARGVPSLPLPARSPDDRRRRAEPQIALLPYASAPATTAPRVPAFSRANPRKQSIQAMSMARDAAPAYHPLGFRPLRPPGFKAPPTCPRPRR
jgi:hypothetical protein